MIKNGKLKLLLTTLVLIGGFFIATSDVKAADAVCNGKKSGTVCNMGDGKSAEMGVCDASGNCVLDSTKVTAPSSNNGQISDNIIPGTTGADSKFIKCGRSGQRMCTLCDLIAALNLVIQYIMKISIGVGILAFAAGGVMYIISAGDPGMKGKGNKTMRSAAIGFVIIFAGWLIVNTVILALGSKTDANGNATFGMAITGWGKFECEANSNR